MAYTIDSQNLEQKSTFDLPLPAFADHQIRIAVLPAMTYALTAAVMSATLFVPSYAQADTSAVDRHGAAITADRTPVTSTAGKNAPQVTSKASSSSATYLVVTTNQDYTADAADCTPQTAPGTGTDAACSLADALVYAGNAGSGNISFSSTVFKASNIAAQNTISVHVVPQGGMPQPLIIPAATTITGPTTVSAGVITNLVTVEGAIGGISSNGTVIFEVDSGISAINNLNLSGGQGAIFNAGGTLTVTNCMISQNNSFGNGGAINNAATMTVKNTSIVSNKSTYYFSQYGPSGGGIGGGIFNAATGTMTVLGSTISGNSDAYANAAGGGIANDGTLTVINSTIANNTATASYASQQPPIGVVLTGTGGGIANIGTLTVISSTISGNTMTVKTESGVTAGPGSGGGGISGVATLENTIVSGNTASNGENDYQGSYTDGFGNIIGLFNAEGGPAPINLSPLGNFGGPTQTMLPMPGSPAIASGNLADVTSSSLTTDQRGLPRTTNYNYGAPNSPRTDSGAVQTNYALAFKVQPPATVKVGVPMTPAPAVELTESGKFIPYTDSSAPVMLIDADQLSNSPNSAFVNGVATFSDATMTGAVTNDTLSATFQLGWSEAFAPGSIAATASQRVSVAAIPAVLKSPAPGSKLTSGTVTFTWTASNVPGTQYGLLIGTQGQGSSNIYVSAALTGTSVTVNVPTNGATLYVGLTQGTTGPWMYTPYTFTEATQSVLVSPAPGSKLTSGKVTFQWTKSTIPGTEYGLLIGTTGQGSSNIYVSPALTGTSITLNVPTTGGTLYVGLTQGTSGPWTYTPYTYTEAGTSGKTGRKKNMIKDR